VLLPCALCSELLELSGALDELPDLRLSPAELLPADVLPADVLPGEVLLCLELELPPSSPCMLSEFRLPGDVSLREFSPDVVPGVRSARADGLPEFSSAADVWW
jgi:hypothetical protein